MVHHCTIAFHEIGPNTANDWPNRVWLAAELDRLSEGINDKFQSLNWKKNWMLRPSFVFMKMKNIPRMRENEALTSPLKINE